MLVGQTASPIEPLLQEVEPNAITQLTMVLPVQLRVRVVEAEQQLAQHHQLVQQWAILDQHAQTMHQPIIRQYKALPLHRVAAVAQELKVEAHHQVAVAVVHHLAVAAADQLEEAADNLIN